MTVENNETTVLTGLFVNTVFFCAGKAAGKSGKIAPIIKIIKNRCVKPAKINLKEALESLVMQRNADEQVLYTKSAKEDFRSNAFSASRQELVCDEVFLLRSHILMLCS